MSGLKDDFKHRKLLLLMSLPAILYALIFSYLPMAGIILAFKDYNYRDGILYSPWNGLKNFDYLLHSGSLWTVSRNTILYNSVFIVTGTIMAVLVAIMMSEMAGKLLKKIVQSFMFLPYFISWVTVSAMMYNFFNLEHGFLNSILKSFGIEPIDIYSSPWYWFILLPLLNIWKYTGYSSIIYLAAIMGFDQSCYEAAIVDGANRYQRIRYITIPLLIPSMVIMFLLSVGNVFKGNFDMFYQTVGQATMLYPYTDVIDVFVFRALTSLNNFGMAAAAGLFQSIINFVILMLVNALVRRINRENALF